MAKEKLPWDRTVLCQVYPWSYKEDGARYPQLGNGSINGITEMLPYIVDAGHSGIWISPFYPSPMRDGGYDVSDYTDIHPALGTLKDFDRLAAACQEEGLRLMLDTVPNHSSDQHPDFQKSRRRVPGYEDRYIWHPGRLDRRGNRVPPNNWASVFSKPNKQARLNGEMPWLRDDEWTPYQSAWQWDALRQEFYMHSFAIEQPDLNWSSPRVRRKLLDAMRFWYDRGVDGYRVDAVNHIGKDMSLPDEPINPDYNERDYPNPFDQLKKVYSSNHREPFHDYVWQMGEVAQEYGDKLLILEAYMSKEETRALAHVMPHIAMPFNFGGMRLEWSAAAYKAQVDEYYANLPEAAFGNQVNGNHDNSRLASRLGDAAARAAFMMKTLMPGMMVIYNGEELGLHDAQIPPERMQDPNGLRDPERTPPIWDHTKPNAGFSNASPDELWLPINQRDLHLSAVNQQSDPLSMLSLTKATNRMRRELPALQNNAYVPYRANNEHVFAFGREHGGKQAVVLTNFTGETQVAQLTSENPVKRRAGRAVLSSVGVHINAAINIDEPIRLQADEALLVTLDD